MQTTHRFFHSYSDVLFPIQIPKTDTPDVYSQAHSLGGKFTRIVHGLPSNSVANFSPCIQKHKDKTFIAWRNQPEPFGFRWDQKYFYLNNTPTSIYIGQLADDSTILGTKALRDKPHRLSYEDPRLFVGPDDELYVQFVTSAYASRYEKPDRIFQSTPKVAVCYVNENCEGVQAVYPPLGQNRVVNKLEKNWCFFSHKETLHCLYSTRNIVIERENDKPIEIDTTILDEVTQKCPTFNSTAPIDIGSGYLVFYHWKHMVATASNFKYLLYHLGCFVIDKELTKITYIDRQPLFTGSLNDQLIHWTNYYGQPVSTQPAVLLPFGALVENDELVMSLGVNDAFMGIFRCPIENILKRLERVD